MFRQPLRSPLPLAESGAVIAGAAAAEPPETALTIDSIGALVPREGFVATVHSVFDRACNWQAGDLLLTLIAADFGRGPTTLRLAGDAPLPLGRLFAPGERIDCRDGFVHAPRVRLLLKRAASWSDPGAPAAWRRAGDGGRVALAEATLARFRRALPSPWPAGFDAAAARLEEACLALDAQAAHRAARRLVGWGEGLTPAGDDFLVGLLAALAALLRDSPARSRFRQSLAEGVVADAVRTTALSSQWLRLAAAGHFAETLCTLRNALLGEGSGEAFERTLGDALAVGASSGADTVAGLLAGWRAWDGRGAADGGS